jgi:copper chaperone
MLGDQAGLVLGQQLGLDAVHAQRLADGRSAATVVAGDQHRLHAGGVQGLDGATRRCLQRVAEGQRPDELRREGHVGQPRNAAPLGFQRVRTRQQWRQVHAELVHEFEFRLPDMTCGHCASGVTQTLKRTDPARTVTVDLNAQEVRVQSAEDRQTLADALTEAGYAPA